MSSSSIPAPHDLPACWDFLAEGVDHIMTRLHTGVSPSKYMSLYTVAYNYCTQTSSKYSGVNYLAKTSADFIGSDLYSRLIRYFVSHLNRLREASADLQDEALLKYYTDEWDRYTLGASYVNRLFTYLNRHWVKRERDEGRRQIYEVYTLALDQWRSNFFTPIQQQRTRLANAVMNLIEVQRNGGVIDQGLVKKVVDSLVSIGIDKQDPSLTCLDVYTSDFEIPFLTATEKYYSQESETFLANNSVSDYLKKSQDRLKEEEDRVDRYLNTTTRRPLVQKCEEILLRKQLTPLLASFSRMLEFDHDDDLKRMYALMSRMGHDEGVKPLYKQFQDYITKAGQSAVEKLVGEEALTTPATVDPKFYVDALLRVYRKGLDTVTRNFEGSPGFLAGLDQACQTYINHNAVTGKSSSRSPEMLAKHADQLLRKSNKASEHDLEASLTEVMILFKYIDDKDVFQHFYTTKLSKRLIHEVSASDEAESSMITRLKASCGWDYTSKLERMFTDMRTGKDKTETFRRTMAEKYGELDMTFTMMVGCSFLWPLSPPAHAFTVPAEVRQTYDRFTNWYSETIHPNHKLDWLWNYSKMELRTNYLNQKYIFMTSAYQSAILLQFNSQDTISLEDLMTATSLPMDIILQVLNLLCKAKVLLSDEQNEYDLNPGFKSKKIRVNLNQPIKAEVRVEEVKILDNVEAGRAFEIQAAIIRIMKARKRAKNQPLIREVVSQVSTRFSPKIPDIKKAIAILLEKDYIERVDETTDVYAYVA